MFNLAAKKKKKTRWLLAVRWRSSETGSGAEGAEQQGDGAAGFQGEQNEGSLTRCGTKHFWGGKKKNPDLCTLVGGSRSQLLLTAHYHATVGRHLITTGLIHFKLFLPGTCQDVSETFAEDSQEFRTQVKCVLVNGRVWRSAKENDVKCNHLFPWKCSFCQASHWTDMVVFPQSQEILV